MDCVNAETDRQSHTHTHTHNGRPIPGWWTTKWSAINSRPNNQLTIHEADRVVRSRSVHLSQQQTKHELGDEAVRDRVELSVLSLLAARAAPSPLSVQDHLR